MTTARWWAMLRKRSVISACALFALVVTACGSTLPEQEVAEVAGNQVESLGENTLPPGAHVNRKGQVIDARGEIIGSAEDFGLARHSGGTVAAGTTRPSGSSGATAGGSTSPAVNGPGVTDRTITLGVSYAKNNDAYTRALGINTGSFDGKAAWQALIKYQNAHGGIAGRRIKLVFFEFDPNENWTQQDQEACALWTQDNQVFGAIYGGKSDSFINCMLNAGSVLTSGASQATLAITPMLRKYPYYIEPIALSHDRGARAMVEGLYQAGYFEKRIRLGLVSIDDPRFKYAVDEGLIPALRRRGVSLSATAYVKYPESLSDYGQVSNEAANAALRFKTEGIDHVVFVDFSSSAAYFFMLAAERQDYHPRYGLNSLAGHQALVTLLGGGSDAANQLRGALGVGWIPGLDVREQDDPFANHPTKSLCLSIMRKGGVEMTGISGRQIAVSQCDALWSMASALEGAKVLNQSSYLSSMDRLRGQYSPGTVWSTLLSPTRHDGVSSVANLEFKDDCTCFKYVSKPYSLP